MFLTWTKVILQFTHKNTHVRMGKCFMKKKKNNRDQPNMKIYYKVAVIKTGWHRCSAGMGIQISGTEQKVQK